MSDKVLGAELYEDNAGNLHMFALADGEPVWAGVYDAEHVEEAAVDWYHLAAGEDTSGWGRYYDGNAEMYEAYEQVSGWAADGSGGAMQVADREWTDRLPYGIGRAVLGAAGEAFAGVFAHRREMTWRGVDDLAVEKRDEARDSQERCGHKGHEGRSER